MQTLRTLLFLLLVSAPIVAQDHLVFEESGFKSAMAKAKAENKILFYMLYADWCPHCKKMKAEVFTDKKVIDFMSANFVCGWQNIETGEGPALRKKLNTKLFPYFVFINPEGKIVYAVSGELKSEDMIREATSALDPSQQIPYLEDQFLADQSNADKCLALLTTMRKGYERAALHPIAHAYFSRVPDDKMVSDINWKIMANGIADIELREFQFLMKHQKEYAAVSSPERVERKILNAVTETMQVFGSSDDTIAYFQKREVIQAMQMRKTDSLLFRYDMEIGSRTKNWKFYREATAQNVKKFAWTSAPLLKEIAGNYLEYYADTQSLQYALEWISRALELNKTVENQLIMARIYYKMGRKKEALQSARDAKAMAQQYGFNQADADALISTYEKS